MIDLFTWPTPNGRKISIMLEETQVSYTVHPVNIAKGDQHKSDFIKLSPNGKIPAIIDNDTNIKMMESGSILLYLAEKTGLFLPEQKEIRFKTIEWLMWQMGGVGPMLGQIHHFTKFNHGVSQYAEERYLSEGKRLYSVLDKRLLHNEYLNGASYSIADIAVWPWIARHDWQTIDLKKFPNVERWYISISDRPKVRAGWNIPETEQKIPLPVEM